MGQDISLKCVFPPGTDFKKIIATVDPKSRIYAYSGIKGGPVTVEARLSTVPNDRYFKYLQKKTNEQFQLNINNSYQDLRWMGHCGGGTSTVFAYSSNLVCPSCNQKVKRKHSLKDEEWYDEDGNDHYMSYFKCPQCNHVDHDVQYEKLKRGIK
jgi:hypothetical protein